MNGPSITDLSSVHWCGDVDGYLRLLDQTRLPLELRFVDCHHVRDVWQAIQTMVVRGAPAIGIAAAYGVVLGMQELSGRSHDERLGVVRNVCEMLATSRPTAVNLFWALRRMEERAQSVGASNSDLAFRQAMLDEAQRIQDDDRRVCHAIGAHGAALLEEGWGVLTHCNTGGLATAEYGTALSVLFTAQDQGRRLHVYVSETRPLLQGARLTAWELLKRELPATLICDSAAAQVMKEGRVQAVITGADRVAANGDTANKIGTYGLALLAAAHQIPFFVAAPCSTFDLDTADGRQIPIEQRPAHEVTHGFGRQTAPDGVCVYNPAFDVTPARHIQAIITERGVIEPVTAITIQRMIGATSNGSGSES